MKEMTYRNLDLLIGETNGKYVAIVEDPRLGGARHEFSLPFSEPDFGQTRARRSKRESLDLARWRKIAAARESSRGAG